MANIRSVSRCEMNTRVINRNNRRIKKLRIIFSIIILFICVVSYYIYLYIKFTKIAEKYYIIQHPLWSQRIYTDYKLQHNEYDNCVNVIDIRKITIEKKSAINYYNQFLAANPSITYSDVVSIDLLKNNTEFDYYFSPDINRLTTLDNNEFIIVICIKIYDW